MCPNYQNNGIIENLQFWNTTREKRWVVLLWTLLPAMGMRNKVLQPSVGHNSTLHITHPASLCTTHFPSDNPCENELLWEILPLGPSSLFPSALKLPSHNMYTQGTDFGMTPNKTNGDVVNLSPMQRVTKCQNVVVC